MVNSCTNSRWSTNIVQETWVETGILETALGRVTISVDITFNSFTTNIWIANQTSRTSTDCCMVLSLANGVDCTWVFQEAGINTLVVVTYLVCSTVWIHNTLHWNCKIQISIYQSGRNFIFSHSVEISSFFCEINFGGSRSSKNSIFSIIGALSFWFG